MCITCIIIPCYKHFIHSIIYMLDIIQYKVNMYIMSHFRTTVHSNSSIMCITCIIIPRYTHVIHSVIYMLDIIQYNVNLYNVTLPHNCDSKYQYNVHNMHNYTTLYTCYTQCYIHVRHNYNYYIHYKVNVYNVILICTTACASVMCITPINPLP